MYARSLAAVNTLEQQFGAPWAMHCRVQPGGRCCCGRDHGLLRCKPRMHAGTNPHTRTHARTHTRTQTHANTHTHTYTSTYTHINTHRHAVDAVPALPGQPAPGRAVHQPRLPHFLPAQKGGQGAFGGAQHAGALCRPVVTARGSSTGSSGSSSSSSAAGLAAVMQQRQQQHPPIASYTIG